MIHISCQVLFSLKKRNAGRAVNSVDPDQMLHSAISDLGLLCLFVPVCFYTQGYYCRGFLKIFSFTTTKKV